MAQIKLSRNINFTDKFAQLNMVKIDLKSGKTCL